MSDTEEHDQDGENEIPEGMEKRVRRVRRRKKGSAKKESAASILERGKMLLERMQMQDEIGHVGVAEQMRRLQKDEEEDKPLDDVWGTKKRSSSWLWVSLLGIIVPLIVVGIGLKYFLNETESEQVSIKELEVTLIEENNSVLQEGPLAWFYRDSTKYLDEAQEILGVVNSASSAEEIEQFLRGSSYRDVNPVKAGYWDSPMDVNNINKIKWEPRAIPVLNGEGEGGERGVLAITGRRKNQEKFTAYFVKEGHQFLLDWDATTGWSEMSLLDLRAMRPKEPKEIRCTIEKKSIHDLKFGGVTYSGYVLSVPETDEFLFAYVPLVDEQQRDLDHSMREVLQYGRFVMHLKHDEPVMLKVKHGRRGLFEVVDLKHEGWVTP